MSNYWGTRYLQTLSKVESATSPRVRTAYLDLARHYKAMELLCDGKELRKAA